MVFKRNGEGFTLVEVLIALSISVFVSVIAYTSLTAAMTGAERTREVADRIYEVNRAWMLLSRDMSHFVPRPVRDEYGEIEPSMAGGRIARFALSLTRTGWHNSVGQPRSHMQRVNYRLEDEVLWRDTYAVLDRAGDTEPREVKLLQDVESLQVRFLPTVEAAQLAGNSLLLDTRDWEENWVIDTTTPGELPGPPAAVEILLELKDWGELRRLYVLPPL